MDVWVQISRKTRWENNLESLDAFVQINEWNRCIKWLKCEFNEWLGGFIFIRDIFVDAWIGEFGIDLRDIAKVSFS